MSFLFNFTFGLRLRRNLAAIRHQKLAHQHSLTQSGWCSTRTSQLLALRTYLIQTLWATYECLLGEAADEFEHHAQRDEGMTSVCWSTNALPLSLNCPCKWPGAFVRARLPKPRCRR
jgi:hypothetical protein